MVLLICPLLFDSSPLIAYLISRPLPSERQILTAEQVKYLRAVARRTWRFFETFVCAEDNWLPPDNFQEDPVPVVAHRTSPTNIGLLFLATSSARDLGYVGSLEFVERQELTFAAIDKLARMNGHLFNWYDTKTLQPLQPQYISSVDSGNLAGHLIAVKQNCIELPDLKLFDSRVIEVLGDTLYSISVAAIRLGSVRQRTEVVTVRQLQDEIDACHQLLQLENQESLLSWFVLIDSLRQRASDIEDIVNALSHEHGEVNFKELRWWVGALQHQVSCLRRDADMLCSWGRLLPSLQRELKDAGDSWKPVLKLLSTVPAPADVPRLCDNALVELAVLQAEPFGCSSETTSRLNRALEQAAVSAGDMLSRLSRLAARCSRLVDEMDFKFLFDVERKLFTIGYNVTASRADDSYYDLLATEARLASFVSIAKGDVAQEHWFRMGRPLAKVNSGRALISWTGTMFEYLMPLLVMRNYPGTLLDETYRSVVHRQEEYGQERGVPWVFPKLPTTYATSTQLSIRSFGVRAWSSAAKAWLSRRTQQCLRQIDSIRAISLQRLEKMVHSAPTVSTSRSITAERLPQDQRTW